LAALAGAAQTTATTKSGVRVTETTVSPNHWTHGALPRRFEIENLSPERRTVAVELPAFAYSGVNGIRSLSGSVEIEPGTRAVLTLTQPPVRLVGDDRFAVQVPKFKRETFRSHVNAFDESGYRLKPSLLLSRALSAERLKERLVECAPDEGRRGRRKTEFAGYTRQDLESFTPVRLERDMAAWPAEWLDYSGFDGCLMTADEFAALPVAARRALGEYVAAGGTLTVAGPGTVEPEWPFAGPAWHEPEPGVSERAFGFGRVARVAESDFRHLPTNSLARLAAVWNDSQKAWRRGIKVSGSGLVPARLLGSETDCMADIPVATDLRVPVNRLLALLLVFALAAGPGAVFVTARLDRRIWLLWIVPAFSLVFSLVSAVCVLLAEGVTPSVRRQAVTLLDQARRQAVTLGAVGVYAPLALSGGLEFDGGTEVTPLARGETRTQTRVVCAGRQRFESGWVVPRVPAWFRVRRSEGRSERLVVTEQADGAVEVVNALGAPVRRLVLRTRGGALYEAEGLAPGEKRALAAGADAGDRATERLREAYGTTSPGWGVAALAEEVAKKGWGKLGMPGRGAYLAVLDGCPFIENPVGERKVKASGEALVAGSY
jgi:hypothetical protein